jgi:hypothetical protein
MHNGRCQLCAYQYFTNNPTFNDLKGTDGGAGSGTWFRPFLSHYLWDQRTALHTDGHWNFRPASRHFLNLCAVNVKEQNSTSRPLARVLFSEQNRNSRACGPFSWYAILG